MLFILLLVALCFASDLVDKGQYVPASIVVGVAIMCGTAIYIIRGDE